MTNTARFPNAAAMRLLLERILATVDDEPDYDVAESLMDRYVDERVAGRDTGAFDGVLDAHLRQAPESADAVGALEDLATLEAAGNLPDVDALWSEVRLACRDGSPERSAAPRASVNSEAAPSRSWLPSWLGGPSPSVYPAVPVMLLAMLVVTSVGWWRADDRADRNGELMQTVASSTVFRFHKMGDGAWARVAYDPDASHAVVWAGGIPKASDGERYECWFRRGNGERIVARALERLHGDPTWYHLETDRLVDAYDSFVMTREPQGDVVIEVALHDPNARR